MNGADDGADASDDGDVLCYDKLMIGYYEWNH